MGNTVDAHWIYSERTKTAELEKKVLLILTGYVIMGVFH